MLKKVAVVTGANKGIGLAVAKGLCGKWTGDILLTARNEENGQRALQALSTLTHGDQEAVFHQLDITDKKSIDSFAGFVREKYGGIDVLINNAGIAFKVADTTPFGTQAEVTMQTNYFGTLAVSKVLLKLVRPGGRVVNVSSFQSKRALAACSTELQAQLRSETITEEELTELMNRFVEDAKQGRHQDNGWANSAYGVSKIGVTVMSLIHARELSRNRPNDNILLNACCPGWVRTDMAGPKAPKSPEEGAETPLFLALLPPGAGEPHGRFVSEKQAEPW